MRFEIQGNLVDIYQKRVYPAKIKVIEGRIAEIEELQDNQLHYILPGFIDAHVHIESSMLLPSEFAREAVKHGTIATVSDPHEIANVCGLEGIRFMIDNGRKTPFHFYFGAPSCVPATSLETSGSTLLAEDIENILAWDDIYYLAEMMNFPGVLSQDAEVMAKLQAAKKRGKVIDGHAPGLRAEAARQYFGVGISTDHECFDLEEAMEKAALGVKILIREGSAARNFAHLLPLLKVFPQQVMFCSDDKHPDDLLQGHMNLLVQKAVHLGYDLFDVLAACTRNPHEHYGLKCGMLRQGDPADFIRVNNLNDFTILETFLGGQKVFDGKNVHIPRIVEKAINNFKAVPILAADLQVVRKGDYLRVIEAIDGELITRSLKIKLSADSPFVQSDPLQDVLKIVVVNRYAPSPPAIGFIKNFGLKTGAMASTIAHDSHNIIAVGACDEALLAAINHTIDHQGGICVADAGKLTFLPLPVAGLMALEPASEVALAYQQLDKAARQLGCTLQAPFMSLAFMSLLVIPELKLSDKGLFDGNSFTFASLFA